MAPPEILARKVLCVDDWKAPLCLVPTWHDNGLSELMGLFLRSAFYLALLFCTDARVWAGGFPVKGPTVLGRVARLKRGIAYAPASAPLVVKRAIWAANELRSKPYRLGGGHGSFVDRGYDCSGTISYALAGAGLIRAPLCSTELTRFGDCGRGRWITVYARGGHAFAVIAGLRLDTTAWDDREGHFAPRWQMSYRPPEGFEARHPIGL